MAMLKNQMIYRYILMSISFWGDCCSTYILSGEHPVKLTEKNEGRHIQQMFGRGGLQGTNPNRQWILLVDNILF